MRNSPHGLRKARFEPAHIRASVASVTRKVARIAVNIAKLPELLRKV